jgi:hypothetical protein
MEEPINITVKIDKSANDKLDLLKLEINKKSNIRATKGTILSCLIRSATCKSILESITRIKLD